MTIRAFGNFFAVSVLVCIGCNATVFLGQLEIGNQELQMVNHLEFDVVQEEGDIVHVDLFYAPSRIFLGPESTTNTDSLIVFEDGFELGGRQLPLETQTFRSDSTGIVEIPNCSEKTNGIKRKFAGYDGCVYRYETESSNAFSNLSSVVSSVDKELWKSFWPRVEVEQFMQGKWEKLSRYCTASLNMSCYLAPADTIKVRMKFGLMSLRYYPNRLVIEKAAATDIEKCEIEVRKPTNGYWFGLIGDEQIFFKEFKSKKLAVDELFEYSFPAHTGMHSFDIYVVNNGVVQMFRQELNVFGPALYTADDELSTWPLLPTPNNVNNVDLIDKGYPGEGLYPLWAVEKAMEIGINMMLTTDDTNEAVYGEIIHDWIVEKRKLEKELRQR